MNNDRFLTRVWDTQEKKMIPPIMIVGVRPDGFYLHVLDDHRGDGELFSTGNFIPFGDRFVPMQCLGNTDKNKKLIYSADIVATSNNQYLVYWEEESAAFWFKRLDNECEILINDFGCEIEIIGNIYENKNLLEVGE